MNKELRASAERILCAMLSNPVMQTPAYLVNPGKVVDFNPGEWRKSPLEVREDSKEAITPLSPPDWPALAVQHAKRLDELCEQEEKLAFESISHYVDIRCPICGSPNIESDEEHMFCDSCKKWSVQYWEQHNG